MYQNKNNIPEIVQILIGIILFSGIIWYVTNETRDYPSNAQVQYGTE